MADYAMPDVVEKRVRFFDGQYLQDQDFVDEQKYHLDRERRHNRLLHVSGIADGLEVTATVANQVTVKPGTAIDDDGRQLVLADETVVDLPAEKYNDVSGIKLHLKYEEKAGDVQTATGSEAHTRWLEQPQLLTLLPSEDDQGAPVLLAKLALDGSGHVTVDSSARAYSGVRLPGPSDKTATLRTGADGRVSLDTDSGVGTTARLSIESNGNVGIGTSQPEAKLEVQGDGGWSTNLLVNGRMHSSGRYGGLIVGSSDNFRLVGAAYDYLIGFVNRSWALVVDDKQNVGIGIDVNRPKSRLHVKGQVFVDGSVGIGATTPKARLHVEGVGGDNVDLLVSGRLRSGSAVGGLWVGDRVFFGGSAYADETDEPYLSGHLVGFYTEVETGSETETEVETEGDWRLVVAPDGKVGIGTTKPTHTLSVNGRMSVQDGVIQRGGTPITNTTDLGLYSHVKGNHIRIVTNSAPIQFYADGGTSAIGSDVLMQINTSGNVTIKGSLTQRSDIRLKTAVRPISDALRAVLRLKGTRYRWREDGTEYVANDTSSTIPADPHTTDLANRPLGSTEREPAARGVVGDHIGLIAQDVEHVVPEVVHTNKEGFKSIAYGHLTALLVEAITEQHAEVAAFSDKMAALAERVTALEG